MVVVMPAVVVLVVAAVLVVVVLVVVQAAVALQAIVMAWGFGPPHRAASTASPMLFRHDTGPRNTLLASPQPDGQLVAGALVTQRGHGPGVCNSR